MRGPEIVFITGTDTGIGKTIVSAILVTSLRRQGIRALAIKPIETGCVESGGTLHAADAHLLQRMSGENYETGFFRYRASVAPLVAARLEGKAIDRNELKQKIILCAKGVQILLVEGAGGLLVPLSENYTFADLTLDLGMKTVVVVGSRLGAINHAALTFETLRSRRIATLGYICNDLWQGSALQGEKRQSETEALRTNRALLLETAQHYEIPELGYLPRFNSVLTPNDIEEIIIDRNVQALSQRFNQSLETRLL